MRAARRRAGGAAVCGGGGCGGGTDRRRRRRGDAREQPERAQPPIEEGDGHCRSRRWERLTHSPEDEERDACCTMADGVQARQDVFSLPAISLPLVGNKKLCEYHKFKILTSVVSKWEFHNARIGHFWQPVADMLGASREATGCHCWVRIFAILHLRLPSLLMLVLCHNL